MSEKKVQIGALVRRYTHMGDHAEYSTTLVSVDPDMSIAEFVSRHLGPRYRGERVDYTDSISLFYVEPPPSPDDPPF